MFCALFDVLDCDVAEADEGSGGFDDCAEYWKMSSDWAFDLSLSMTAVKEPLRFFACPFSPEATTDDDDDEDIDVSDGDVDNESDLGEFAADFRADILGFPPELAPDECFGDEIECFGLEARL